MANVHLMGTRRAAGLIAALGLLALVMVPRAAAQRATAPTPLIFWTWATLGTDKAVAIYNAAHPDVHIIMRDPGNLYTKLTTVIKAGEGAPDMTQIEYQFLPQYLDQGGIADLSTYGLNAVKTKFAPWTWAQVSRGSSVYAVPWDTGPMALFYRADVFAKLGLSAPKTWSEFAADAAILHKADPTTYISSFDPTDGGWLTGLIWQDGGRLFTKQGNTWTVTINNPAAVKVVNFWGDMIRKGLIKVQSDFAIGVYSDWNKGKVLAWVTAVWGQTIISGNAMNTAGKWRVAPMPQWNAGGPFVDGNWGGSTIAVTTQSKHPREAAQFATWLFTDRTAYSDMVKGLGVWPAATTLLDLPILTGPNAFYGGQHLAAIFSAASRAVNTNFAWGPQMSYTYNTLGVNLQAAARGAMSFTAALDKTQNQVVSFLSSQGYNVAH
jgi:multiple sugar transport system substrate-binding protein